MALAGGFPPITPSREKAPPEAVAFPAVETPVQTIPIQKEPLMKTALLVIDTQQSLLDMQPYRA